MDVDKLVVEIQLPEIKCWVLWRIFRVFDNLMKLSLFFKFILTVIFQIYLDYVLNLL